MIAPQAVRASPQSHKQRRAPHRTARRRAPHRTARRDSGGAPHIATPAACSTPAAPHPERGTYHRVTIHAVRLPRCGSRAPRCGSRAPRPRRGVPFARPPLARAPQVPRGCGSAPCKRGGDRFGFSTYVSWRGCGSVPHAMARGGMVKRHDGVH
eukprot:gene4135-biopygen12556